MARKVASPKATGGGGFTYADKVIAWYLACMLADTAPLASDLGSLTRIHLESRVDGWLADDAVLVIGNPPCNCAVSIKSAQQFTGAKPPAEFLQDVWEQYLQVDSGRFDPTTDYLALACPAPDTTLRTALESLIGKARKQDPALLAARLPETGWTSDTERDLFANFACPAALAQGSGITAADTARLLARVYILWYDFDGTASDSERQALRVCRDALRSKEALEANKLWNALLRLVRDHAPSAGSIDRHWLLGRLREQFRLQDLPHHEPDWERLDTLSTGYAAEVNNAIAGTVHLDRSAMLDVLDTVARTSRALLLVGPSGTGKSGLARDWFDRLRQEGARTLWFAARSLERADFAAFQADLSVTHALSELLKATPQPNAVVVLDGLDRIYGAESFGLVVHLVSLLELEQPGPWRVLVTCQTSEWPRVHRALRQAGMRMPWHCTTCAPLEPADLEPVWLQFPEARWLSSQARLRRLLSNLKILDLITSHLSPADEAEVQAWVGESSIASWYWATVVASGPQSAQRARFAMLLAEQHAASLSTTTPLDQFGVADLPPLSELASDEVCRRTEDDRVEFSHELYGDWTRLRCLVAHCDDLLTYLADRLTSPLWHRAVRLYGLYLLEHRYDPEQWGKALARMGTCADNAIADAAYDLLLEAPAFTADSRRALARLHEALVANDGDLLKRLLTRFIAFATTADPETEALAQGQGIDPDALGSQTRIPDWPYWPGMLAYLHDHQDAVLSAAPHQTAQILNTWLSRTPQGSPLRQEAAELALELGRRAHAVHRLYDAPFTEHRTLYYTVALQAAANLPEATAAFALEAAQRTDEDTSITHKEEGQGNEESVTALSQALQGDPRFDPNAPLPDPWPDGPKRRVDDRFRRVALEPTILLPLFRADPATACEVALAVLIRDRRRHDWRSLRQPADHVHLCSVRWLPALYTHGPFLSFLLLDFEEGFRLVARLVDFATERWLTRDYPSWESQDAEDRAAPHAAPITLTWPDGSARAYSGDRDVYGWAAGLGNAHDAVQAALSALEKFFYLQLDHERTINAQVTHVLRRGRSVAHLKVLIDVGKRHTALFEDALLPLLAVPELYAWDIENTVRGRTHQLIGAIFNGAAFANAAQHFHNLEHRTIELRQITARLALACPAVGEFIQAATPTWQQRLCDNPDDPLAAVIRQLCCMGPQNYERQEIEDGVTLLVNQNIMALDEQHAAGAQKAQERLQYLGLSLRCREILEGQRALTAEQVPALFEAIQRLAQEDSPLHHMPVTATLEGMTAGAAVLLVMHQDWLTGHPEAQTWCWEVMCRLLVDPPRTEFDTPTNPLPTWDTFAAEAIAHRLLREQENEEARALASLLVMRAPHYRAIGVLLARCQREGNRLSHTLAQLRRLVFVRSYAIERLRFLLKLGDYEHEERESQEQLAEVVVQWLDEQHSSFVDGSLPTATNDWDAMDAPERFQDVDAHRPSWQWAGYADLAVIRHAHPWMTDALSDSDERMTSVTFWRQALRFVLVRMQPDRRDRWDSARMLPLEDERWALEGAAAALLCLCSTEDARRMYEAVLNLDGDAAYWPQTFLSALHCRALELATLPERYLSVVDSILDHVLARPSPSWADHEEVWSALVGLDSISLHRWEERHRPLAVAFESTLCRWLQELPPSFVRTERLAAWAITSAGQPIRLAVLCWLSDQDRISSHVLEGPRTAQAVAGLLAGAWQEQSNEIRLNATIRAAFQHLLQRLVTLQQPRALLLQRRIEGQA